MLGVYIHIPFCKNICSYCDFCKMYYNKKWINQYLNELELTNDQKQVCDDVINGEENCYLLEGVTGSGKTQVFLKNDIINYLLYIDGMIKYN